MPVTSQFLDHMHHPWRQHVAAGGENARQFGAQEARPLPHRDPAVQQEGTNLVDDTGALADQPCSNPVQRLQVELLGCLGGDEFHRRALYRLGDRFAVAEIVLLPARWQPSTSTNRSSR
jgi:hypothetical protein